MDNLVRDTEDHMNFMIDMRRRGGTEERSPYHQHIWATMGPTVAPRVGVYNAHCRLAISYMEQKAFTNDPTNPLSEIHESTKGTHRHASVSNTQFNIEMREHYPDYVREVTLVEDVDKAVEIRRRNGDRRPEEEIRAGFMSPKDLKPGDEIHVPSELSQSGRHAIMYKGVDEDGNYMAISHNSEKLWDVMKDSDPGTVIVYQKNDLVMDKLRNNFNEIEKEQGRAVALEYLRGNPPPTRVVNDNSAEVTREASNVNDRVPMSRIEGISAGDISPPSANNNQAAMNQMVMSRLRSASRF
jgi:hypothetical protein